MKAKALNDMNSLERFPVLFNLAMLVQARSIPARFTVSTIEPQGQLCASVDIDVRDVGIQNCVIYILKLARYIFVQASLPAFVLVSKVSPFIDPVFIAEGEDIEVIKEEVLEEKEAELSDQEGDSKDAEDIEEFKSSHPSFSSFPSVPAALLPQPASSSAASLLQQSRNDHLAASMQLVPHDQHIAPSSSISFFLWISSSFYPSCIGIQIIIISVYLQFFLFFLINYSQQIVIYISGGGVRRKAYAWGQEIRRRT
jgi:hypothetical protein